MADVLRINNTLYSWTSCSFKIDLAPYLGIVSIKNGQKRDRTKVWGMDKSGRALGRTRGKYDLDPVEITFLEDTYNSLCTYLAVKGLGSIGDAEVQGILSVSELGKEPIIITFQDMVLVSESDDKKEGPEGNMIVATFDIMGLYRNFKPMFSIGQALGL